MPGPIIKASQVSSEYGSGFASTKNGKVRLKNSDGKTVSVHGTTPVYHRGKKNFGVYSEKRDKKVRAKGSSGGDRVGSGNYRQTGDKRGKKVAAYKEAKSKRHAPRENHRKRRK